MLAALLATYLLQPPDTALVLQAVRFYRADPNQSQGQTQVTAMLRIPPGLPEPGRRGEVSLTLAVRVLGDGGAALYEQSWQKRTAVPFPRGDADRLDVLRFSLGPGSYRLEASVVDSVSGRRSDAAVPIEAYPIQPPASDLLLSHWVRPVAKIDTIPQPGEFRRGSLILAIAPDLVVGGSSASIAYLFETYSGTALEGTLKLAVVDDAEGGTLRHTEPTPVRIAAGIGLLTGAIDVGTLQPGAYRLVAALDLGGQAVTRESRFVVDPSAGALPAALGDDAWFARLAGSELDRAFAPLDLVAEPGELSGWPAAGSDAAKRSFLAGFWRRRDPTPQTGNERRARFYDGVVYANSFYAEPTRRVEGWETDRGRVFLREGLPTQVLRREERGRVPAYEVWRYFDRGDRYYLFADRGVMGFRLLRSNDPRESREPRWQEILSPDGVREVVSFLGRGVLAPER